MSIVDLSQSGRVDLYIQMNGKGSGFRRVVLEVEVVGR